MRPQCRTELVQRRSGQFQATSRAQRPVPSYPSVFAIAAIAISSSAISQVYVKGHKQTRCKAQIADTKVRHKGIPQSARNYCKTRVSCRPGALPDQDQVQLRSSFWRAKAEGEARSVTQAPPSGNLDNSTRFRPAGLHPTRKWAPIPSSCSMTAPRAWDASPNTSIGATPYPSAVAKTMVIGARPRKLHRNETLGTILTSALELGIDIP